jgi:Predicted sugar phosphatases of the HAD superfamily
MSQSSGSQRIVLDIDGTIFKLKWPALGEWIPGAANFIRTLQANGYEVVLYSTRLAPMEIDEVTPRGQRACDDEVNGVRLRLAEEGLQDLPIWDKPWKPGGIAYIDDKGVHADGNWRRILKEIAALDPAKKKPKTSMYLPLDETARLTPGGIRRRVNGGTSTAPFH